MIYDFIYRSIVRFLWKMHNMQEYDKINMQRMQFDNKGETNI